MRTECKNVESTSVDTEVFKNWVNNWKVGDHDQLRNKVCAHLGWNSNKWKNKNAGRVRFSMLEKKALNELAGYELYKL